MNRRSLAWYAAIEKTVDLPWDAEHPVTEPVVPFITHAVHPKVVELMLRLGIERHLRAGELIYRTGEPVEHLVLVKKGITAREVGQGSNVIAIATPGHFACGNLNFFSSLACIGRYFALVDSEILFVPQRLMRQMLKTEPDLGHIFSVQLELCTLSDRMAFGAYALSAVSERLKVFFIAWYRNYGRLLQQGAGGSWCVMPLPVQRKYLASVINSSRVWLDKTFKDWSDRGLYALQGDYVLMRPVLLESAYRWMIGMEEAAKNARPDSYTQWLNDIEERRRRIGAVVPPVTLPQGGNA